MGLLDDAIREHLDLKRRRGADPTEVERLEREALGPVRRNTGAAVDEAEPELTDDSVYDEADDPIAADDADIELGYTGAPAVAEPEPWDLDDERTRIVSRRSDEPVAQRPEPPVAEPAGGAGDDDAEDDDDFVSHPPAAMADPESGAPPPLELIRRRDEPIDDGPPEDEPSSGQAGDGETTEYDVEQALAAEASGAGGVRREAEGDEDVLEETPEFFQDAPEHDRLWFEQRPPRDFDFDG